MSVWLRRTRDCRERKKRETALHHHHHLAVARKHTNSFFFLSSSLSLPPSLPFSPFRHGDQRQPHHHHHYHLHPHHHRRHQQQQASISAMIMILIILLIGVPFDTGTILHQASGQVMTGESICGSQYISTSISSFDKLRDCRVIEGNLKIVLFDHTLPAEFVNLTFPHLIEITEYLLIFRVSGLQSLGRLLPNLAVIRGQQLFHNYALVVYQMNSLAELDLQNLRSIDRGAVRIQRNPNLCFADTINWNLIATSVASPKRVHEISVSITSLCLVVRCCTRGCLLFYDCFLVNKQQDNKKKTDCPKCRSSCPLGSTTTISSPSTSSSSSSSSKSSSSSESRQPQQHLCWSVEKCQKGMSICLSSQRGKVCMHVCVCVCVRQRDVRVRV